jgi:hypothetical protein
MGLFGGPRKKPSDPFRAAVEQQSKRTLAARLRASQSESARQRSAHYFRGNGLSAWPGNTREHPYQQPGFGFYSGEQLASGRPGEGEPKRYLSVDEGVRNAQQGSSSELYGRDLSFSPHHRHPGAGFWNGDVCNFADPPFVDRDPWTGLDPRNSPYHVPEEQLLFPDRYDSNSYGLYARMSPLGRPRPRNGRHFPSRDPPFNTAMFADGPVFDGLRPFNNLSMPSSHTAPTYYRDIPSERYPTWSASGRHPRDPEPVTRAAYGSPRLPRSYERLRPPRMQRRGGRAGSASGSQN